MKRKKNNKILLLFILSIMVYNSEAQSGLNDSLVSINLSYYLNKPIDSLIKNLPPSHDSLIVGPDETMFNGARLIINYNNREQGQTLGYIITIWPNTRNFINRKNPQNLPFAEAWPLELLKKESIGQVEIIGPSGNIINSAGN
jgi:hypothetical protein